MDTTAPPSRDGEKRFRGIAVSRGIAKGALQFPENRFVRPRTWPISEGQVEGEIQRLHKSLRSTRLQIQALQREMLDKGADLGEAHIFDAHLLVLEDQTLIDEIASQLRSDRLNAEAVFFKVIQRYIESLRSLDDPYLSERAIDIEDVARRIMANLYETDEEAKPPYHRYIHFAQDLTPSDTVKMDHEALLGFATEFGSYTSHTAIMARALDIPGVVGLDIPTGCLRSGQEVILDGYNGLLILSPSEETQKEYAEIAARQEELNAQLEALRDVPAMTLDGHAITLSANIEFGHEVDFVKRDGAEGIGLFRTEFFYFQSDEPPGEDRQTAMYRSVAEAVDPDGVIIRTLDVGADKFADRHAEPNPFLGWRGIRVSLEKKDLFKTQLRACLRASAFAKVRIMYPMISGIEELRAANVLLQEAKDELDQAGTDYDRNLEVGCMIELPSAALVSEALAKEVAFFSVGTNDLIQYTIAVDRVNERVAHLYQPGHPAILRLLDRIIQAAHAAGIWVGVCGEMAGDTYFTPLLVGLGVDELSVSPSQLLRIKHALQHLERTECQQFVQNLMPLASGTEIWERCREMAKTHYGELFQ